MRIKIDRRKGELDFVVETDQEGKDLKTAVLEAAKKGRVADPIAIAEELEKLGYGIFEPTEEPCPSANA